MILQSHFSTLVLTLCCCFALAFATCFATAKNFASTSKSGKNPFEKLEKFLEKEVANNDGEANYELALTFAAQQRERKLFKDKKSLDLIENWHELVKAKEGKLCDKRTLKAFAYVARSMANREGRLSEILKPLTMEIASQCATNQLDRIYNEIIQNEFSLKSRENLFKLFTDEFIRQHKQLNERNCQNNAQSQLIVSVCNSPYANVDKLARSIMATFPLPSKVTHNGLLPANMQFSSFAHTLKQFVVDPCNEYVEVTWDYFVGLAYLADFWEQDNEFYEKRIGNNEELLNNLFRFNICRQIRNDRQLDVVLLTIIAKLRGEI